MVVCFKYLPKRSFSENINDFIPVANLILGVYLQISMLIIKARCNSADLGSPLAQIVDRVEHLNLVLFNHCQNVLILHYTYLG
jgi:hypothetical protein